MRYVLLAGSLVLLGGCFVRAPGGGPVHRSSSYKRAPPPPQPMSYQEAVDRGYDECRARRLECRLQNANLSHNHRVWKVRMRAAGPRRKGHLFLEYDAHSRRLLRTDAKIRPWRRATPPRWDHDDDWDDDNDGIPNRKDTGGPQRGNSHGASPVRPGKSASNPKGASTPKQASPPKKQDRHDDDDD